MPQKITESWLVASIIHTNKSPYNHIAKRLVNHYQLITMCYNCHILTPVCHLFFNEAREIFFLAMPLCPRVVILDWMMLCNKMLGSAWCGCSAKILFCNWSEIM